MVSAPRSGEAMNGRAIVMPSRGSGPGGRAEPRPYHPGCAQLAVTPVPAGLRASSGVNKMLASLLLA